MVHNRVAPVSHDKYQKRTLVPSNDPDDDAARTKLGLMDDIEWGWLAHERKERRVYWFKLWDGVMAVTVVLHVTLITFCAAFNPYDIPLLRLGYALDICNCVDIGVKVWRYYAHDMRNAEMRKGKSKLDWYTHSWFAVDGLAILPTDIVYQVIPEEIRFLPMLARLRLNRIFCGYRVFRVKIP